MNNPQVAHCWANKTKSRASGSHFYFEGDSIFSYGSHFEAARHVVDKHGAPVVLITTRRYGNSTARHLSYIGRAASHLTVFYAPSFEDHAANVRAFVVELETTHAAVLRALTAGKYHIDRMEEWIKALSRYLESFKVPAKERRAARKWIARQETNTLFTAAQLAEIERRRVAAEERDRVRGETRRRVFEERERLRALAEADRLALWLRGESCGGYVNFAGPVKLRLSADGTRIETSHGAEVGRRVAVELWNRIKAGANPAGSDINGFPIKSYDGETLIIGCHEIPRTELERMAAFLDVEEAHNQAITAA